MKKERIALCVLLAVMVAAFSGCDKEPQPENPTTDTPTGGGSTPGGGIQYGSVTDHEGNVYRTVQIGTQTWMADNMRCTTSPTGKGWHLNPTSRQWEPYCSHSTGTVNGWTYDEYLYNWAAAIDYMPEYNYQFHYQPTEPCRGICPEGWHIPTLDDWDKLEHYVVTNSAYNTPGYDGKALASKIGWNSSTAHSLAIGNNPATNNASGFDAKPAGAYFFSGSDDYHNNFENIGVSAFYWSSRSGGTLDAYKRDLRYESPNMDGASLGKTFGLSVRCVKD